MYRLYDTCDHNSSNISIHQFLDNRFGFRLHFILHYEKPDESQISLHLVPENKNN